MSVCCFTSANLAYLDRVRVLASTFKRYNPNIDFVLLLSDRVTDPDWIHSECFDSVIEAHNLPIDNFLSWSFKHNVVELCTAVKATAALNLLNKYDKVIYLDPDIAVFDNFDDVVSELDQHDIVLTPHQLSPCENTERKLKDIELCSLMHGVFNLGFFAVSGAPEGISFLKWWESRVLKYCYEDIPAGIFTDQKWCDIAPCYFPTLKILRHPGCNVASWNLEERTLKINAEGVWVNESHRLKFYHFTKYRTVGETMTLRYAKTSDSLEIWYWYGRFLDKSGGNIPNSGRYYYDYYTSGEKISNQMRVAFRNSDVRVDDPYSEYQKISCLL
jgi:hypothetical protein